MDTSRSLEQPARRYLKVFSVDGKMCLSLEVAPPQVRPATPRPIAHRRVCERRYELQAQLGSTTIHCPIRNGIGLPTP